MKQDKKLSLSMTIFFLIIFVTFGVIVTTEKMAPYYIPKIDQKLNNYLTENYKDIINDVKVTDTNYKNTVYSLKVISKENKNLYFYITYQNKKITDTYKEDYLKGKTLLTKITKDLEKEINKKTNKQVKVEISRTLDEFSNQVEKRILNEENLLNLKIYNIDLELETNSLTEQELTNTIKTNIGNFTSKNITPNAYNITITDKNDITNSIYITNITYEIVENSSFNLIINDIINNKESNILDKHNITYKYLN